LTAFVRYLLLTLSLPISTAPLLAQEYTVKGYVLDSSRNYPMEAVSVLTSTGKGTITNTDGFYEIRVLENDSIWFSYLGKSTQKFPVLRIANPLQFDVSLQVNVPILREVKIRPRNYRQDSIQNRQDYAKIFDFQKPRITTVTPQYGMGMGFDLQELINIFRFRRNRSMLAFQERLLLEEEDKYVDSRLNKALVRRLTLLEPPILDSFMRLFRPSYDFTKSADDYQFRLYIKQAHYRFRYGLPPDPRYTTRLFPIEE